MRGGWGALGLHYHGNRCLCGTTAVAGSVMAFLAHRLDAPFTPLYVSPFTFVQRKLSRPLTRWRTKHWGPGVPEELPDWLVAGGPASVCVHPVSPVT